MKDNEKKKFKIHTTKPIFDRFNDYHETLIDDFIRVMNDVTKIADNTKPGDYQNNEKELLMIAINKHVCLIAYILRQAIISRMLTKHDSIKADFEDAAKTFSTVLHDAILAAEFPERDHKPEHKQDYKPNHKPR